MKRLILFLSLMSLNCSGQTLDAGNESKTKNNDLMYFENDEGKVVSQMDSANGLRIYNLTIELPEHQSRKVFIAIDSNGLIRKLHVNEGNFDSYKLELDSNEVTDLKAIIWE